MMWLARRRIFMGISKESDLSWHVAEQFHKFYKIWRTTTISGLWYWISKDLREQLPPRQHLSSYSMCIKQPRFLIAASFWCQSNLKSASTQQPQTILIHPPQEQSRTILISTRIDYLRSHIEFAARAGVGASASSSVPQLSYTVVQ
jgi:hypothetical protein